MKIKSLLTAGLLGLSLFVANPGSLVGSAEAAINPLPSVCIGPAGSIGPYPLGGAIEGYTGGVVAGAAGGGSCQVGFSVAAADLPTNGNYAASVLASVLNNFGGTVTVEWLDAAFNTIGAPLVMAPAGAPSFALSTLFDALNPIQYLKFSWTNAASGGVLFDFEVRAGRNNVVPVPGALPLLLTGLGGLGFVAWRRRKAV